MSLLQEKWQAWQQEKKKAFVAYITAGDPDLATTEKIVDVLVAQGVDILELGVPFSDPVGDGPTNQKAAERALGNGTTLSKVLTLAKKIRGKHPHLPLVLFSYFNPLFQMGLKNFAKQCRDSGINGVLTVDLPPEEGEEYARELRQQEVETVFLASPTTAKARLPLIDQLSTGFVYYVSRTGVTGTQQSLSKTLAAEIKALRQNVKKPIAVGFGISTPEQAREVAAVADGVVVGSAIVKLIEEFPINQEAFWKNLEKTVSGLAASIHGR